MLAFVKIRQYRSAAVFVLLGWIFALAVGSVYGCTPAYADHHAAGAAAALDGDEHAARHAGEDHDPCLAACDLQASSVVKEAAGQAPDLQIVAFPIAACFPVFSPPDAGLPHIAGNERLPFQLPSLRFTRLTL